MSQIVLNQLCSSKNATWYLMGQNNISAVWVKSREDLDQEGVELKECGGGGA